MEERRQRWLLLLGVALATYALLWGAVPCLPTGTGHEYWEVVFRQVPSSAFPQRAVSLRPAKGNYYLARGGRTDAGVLERIPAALVEEARVQAFAGKSSEDLAYAEYGARKRSGDLGQRRLFKAPGRNLVYWANEELTQSVKTNLIAARLVPLEFLLWFTCVGMLFGGNSRDASLRGVARRLTGVGVLLSLGIPVRIAATAASPVWPVLESPLTWASPVLIPLGLVTTFVGLHLYAFGALRYRKLPGSFLRRVLEAVVLACPYAVVWDGFGQQVLSGIGFDPQTLAGPVLLPLRPALNLTVLAGVSLGWFVARGHFNGRRADEAADLAAVEETWLDLAADPALGGRGVEAGEAVAEEEG